MEKSSRIYVAGHGGLVGGAIVRALRSGGYGNIVVRTHRELDLADQRETERFFSDERPEYVFLAAARVGGIGANSAYPVEFLYQNTMIGFNVVKAAFQAGVRKLLNLGSTCIYPRMAGQPIREESLLTGPLEQTNEAYALAKIGAIKLCAFYNRQYGTNFLSLMPTNLYGPGDNYDLESSHVLPAMVRKFHEAKVSGRHQVTLWGDGSPLREFLHCDDLADAAIYLMRERDAADLRSEAGDFVNVGSGRELSIRQLAELVRSIVYEDGLGDGERGAGKAGRFPDAACRIVWDASKPNGTPRKLCDITKITNLGFAPKINLEDGIRSAYRQFLQTAGKR